MAPSPSGSALAHLQPCGPKICDQLVFAQNGRRPTAGERTESPRRRSGGSNRSGRAHNQIDESARRRRHRADDAPVWPTRCRDGPRAPIPHSRSTVLISIPGPRSLSDSLPGGRRKKLVGSAVTAPRELLQRLGKRTDHGLQLGQTLVAAMARINVDQEHRVGNSGSRCCIRGISRPTRQNRRDVVGGIEHAVAVVAGTRPCSWRARGCLSGAGWGSPGACREGERPPSDARRTRGRRPTSDRRVR